MLAVRNGYTFYSLCFSLAFLVSVNDFLFSSYKPGLSQILISLHCGLHCVLVVNFIFGTLISSINGSLLVLSSGPNKHQTADSVC